MFCTNCGNSISGTAAFCAECGTRLSASPLQAGRARQPRYAASSRQEATLMMPAARVPASAYMGAPAHGYETTRGATANLGHQGRASAAFARTSDKPLAAFTPLGIVARVAAGLTAVLMLLPWLEVPAMRTLAEYASLLGIDLPDEYAYSMPQMGSVSRMLDMLTSSDAYGTFQTVFFGLWLVALLAIGAGLVVSLTGKRSSTALVFGGALAALVAIMWFAAITYLNGEYSRQLAQFIGFKVEFFAVTPAVWATIITGAATSLLGVLGKRH